MIDHPRNLVTCLVCGASWEGSEGDDCYWCDRAYEQKRQSERDRLLFPEWMNWGDRFYACSDIDRIVWAQTRGFNGDYRGNWENAVCDGLERGIITGAESDAAYGRYERWMTRMRYSGNA